MRKVFKIEVSENRIFGLDLLRTIAILIVVFDHAGSLITSNLRGTYNRIIFNGSDGVTMFFVLSGYLIGKIIIKEFSIERKNLNFKKLLNFWFKRWLRTIPNYFFVLTIIIIFEIQTNSNFTFRSIYRYFFFIQNFFSEIPNTFFVESWSITVEEWFYLIIPLILFLLLRVTKIKLENAILIISFLTLITSLIFRFEKYYIFNPLITFQNQVIGRLDGIMMGVIGSYLYHYHSKKWKSKSFLFFSLGLVFILTNQFILKNKLNSTIYSNVLSHFFIALSILCMLPKLEEIQPKKNIFYTTISSISIISYSIYLLNGTIIKHYIIFQLNWSNYISNEVTISIINYIIYWTLVLTLSKLLYKFIELPFMKLRDSDKVKRFFQSKK